MKNSLFVLILFTSPTAFAVSCDQELKSLNAAIGASDSISNTYVTNASKSFNYLQTIGDALRGATGKPVLSTWGQIILTKIAENSATETENWRTAKTVSTALHVRFSELENCVNTH